MDKEPSNTLFVSSIVFILALLAVIILWGLTRDEKWVLYTNASSYVEHASFNTRENCAEKMKLFKIPVGCKRVDGIHRIMNDGLDSIFR